MASVFVLHHIRELVGGEEEDTKLIGVYATREDAEGAMQRLGQAPGFRDHRSGFEITEYELNQDHWAEGFISWKDAMAPDEQQ